MRENFQTKLCREHWKHVEAGRIFPFGIRKDVKIDEVVGEDISNVKWAPCCWRSKGKRCSHCELGCVVIFLESIIARSIIDEQGLIEKVCVFGFDIGYGGK